MSSKRDYVRGASYDDASSVRGPRTRTNPRDERFRNASFAIVVIFSALALIVVSRLVWLQVVDASRLQQMSWKQRTNVVTLFARRGTIYDRNGNVLAMSRECKTLYCNPKQVKNPARAAQIIADNLGGEASSYIEALTRDSGFSYIAKKISNEDAKSIKDALTKEQIEGVFYQPDIKREYPYGNVAGQVLGLVSNEGEGLTGIENYYNDVLRGTNGEMIFEAGRDGTPIASGDPHIVEATHGSDIVLSIDINLQKKAEEVLAQGVKDCDGDSGSVMATDPATGEILCACSAPGFDPSNPSDLAEGALNLRAVSSAYEPGSIFKIITESIALDSKRVNPKQVFDVPASIQVGDGTVTDDDHRKSAADMDLREILRRSSNVGVALVAQKCIGADVFAQGLDNFMIGQKTGIDYPGEVKGLVKSRIEYDGASLGTMAFGQSLAIPPVQMVQAVSSVANGGNIITPHFLLSKSGEEVSWGVKGRSISEDTCNLIADYMRDVVESGTGKRAQVKGYNVSGKTGTGEQASPTGGYIAGSYVSSFLGFAPSAHARVCLYVGVNSTPQHANTAAAPLFAEIMKEALEDLNVAAQSE